MTIRERLFEISELDISQILMKMRDNQLEAYVQSLNAFVEQFPVLEAQMKNAFAERDYLTYSRKLVAARDMLSDIYAKELADLCQKQMNALVNVNHDKAQAAMTFLLSMMAMLSIDIQVAIYMDENEGDTAPQADAAEEQEAGGKSILAVDDNSFSLDTLKSALADAAYRFTGVNSAADALSYLQSHAPDLYILDIEMPDIDGYELAGRIRSMGKTAPIVFLTGNATRDYVLRALQAGAADFIAKPVTQKVILDKIEKYI